MKNRIHAAIAFCFVSTAVWAAEPVAEAECQGNAIRLYAQPLAYEVVKDGKVVVPRTEIGLRVDGKDLGCSERASMTVKNSSAKPSMVETPVYKKGRIDAGYEDRFVEFGSSDFAVRLVARPDGVAYRFELKKGGVVADEKADLTIPKNARCWFNRTPRAKLGCEETEPEFADASALKTDDGKAFYLPFVYSVDGKTVAVMDTDVHDYPVWYFGDVSESESGVRLSSLFAKYPESTDLSLGGRRGRRNRVRSSSDFIAKADIPRTLPWRVFALADSPSKLCEADISYALATPAKKGDFSWVKPGKVAWDWWNAFDNKGDPQGCTTETYVRFIDFAAANGVEYVIFDEGWSAKLDIWKFSPNVDVPYLIDYANKKGVGIILWMAWCQVEGDEERVVEHFAKLGAKGFKVDFIDRADAQVAVFMEKFAEVCAKHKMLVDYHGVYRPVGLHRTYPNVLNYEGIHGLEQMKWSRRLKDMPYNDVAAFFLRMTAGPMDYTPGAMDNYRVGDYRGNSTNPGSVGTRCHQMALMALYEAPLQMLADSPTKYEKNMECFSFMAKTPVVWDATIGLGGTPESYAAVARKAKDGTWYAAAISNRDARDIEIDTSFLGKGEWEAEIFRDANDADKQPTHYVHDFKYVKAGEQLKFHVAPGGGFVIAFKVAQPVVALVPMPREIKFTKGTCPASAKPKIEKVAGITKEGYELSVTPNGVTIRASGEAGVFYAQQTLAQLVGRADPSAPSPASLPCCEIKDSPRFMWRGVHMDDVRHFMGKDTVKRLIDEIAKYKFNVLHWHLTDDQAWRLEMPEYPELTAKLGSDFYTAADVKEVLAYAAERHVTVVPEVEFPGHFRGVRLAYKDFSCRDAPYPYPMCVGNSNAVLFAEKALDRVCELFTSKVIHFGGDECKRGGWEKCPRCQELIKREGLSGVEAIQPWLTRRLTAHLEAKGRHAIGWDEIFDDAGDSLPKETMGMCWRREGIGAGAANRGYKIVRCPTSHCYFDYAQGLEDDPHDYFCKSSGWKTPIERVYSFNPLDGVAPEAQGNIVGGQCCNWTEKTFNREDLEFKLWPRALALAEVLWTYPDPARRNFAEFKRRAIVRRDEMASRGMNVAPLK